MVLSTTFTQFAPETTKFRKITLNKDHFAVQDHSRSPILVPIESFLCVLHLAVARSSSDSRALRYVHVFPVLWMTSCFYITPGIQGI